MSDLTSLPKFTNFENQVIPPPINMEMAPHADLILTIAMLVAIAIYLVFYRRDFIQSRSLLPITCLIGGFVSSFQEAALDALCMCWHPELGDTLTVWRIFNISVPLWVPFVYTWYIGGQGYLMYKQFEKGITKKQLWIYFFVFWITNAAFEMPGINLGLYTYYGPQPFQIFGFPLWMAMVNCTMPIMIGAMLHAWRDNFSGKGAWWAVLVVPFGMAFGSNGIGWPVWLALSSGHGLMVSRFAALVSLGLSMSVAYLIGQKLTLDKNSKQY